MVDELDRSLHAEMSNNFLDIFLSNSVGKPSQLIVTTHEYELLDLDLNYVDEMKSGLLIRIRSAASAVFSLEEFAPRYDMLTFKRGYLHGTLWCDSNCAKLQRAGMGEVEMARKSRKVQPSQRRKVIYIAFEGSKTERKYFDGVIKQHNGCRNIRLLTKKNTRSSPSDVIKRLDMQKGTRKQVHAVELEEEFWLGI